MQGFKVKLTYFKSSGKYYTEGEYITEHLWAYEVFQEVRTMFAEGKRPGLVDGANEFYTLVSFNDDYPNGYPALIVPTRVETSPRCTWCNTDPVEAAKHFEGPHATWCPRHQTPCPSKELL